LDKDKDFRPSKVVDLGFPDRGKAFLAQGSNDQSAHRWLTQ
jgi:hypothetical protein